MSSRIGLAVAVGLGLAALVAGPGATPAQKYGGVFRTMLSSSPPSLSIHDEATIYTQMPVMPVYNNLALYDPFRKQEGQETIIPELATEWAWDADHRRLTFKLRQGVKWHDGKPFTAADVKHTFDVVRGKAKQRLKLNPRRLWYQNVEDVTTKGDHEVTFHLQRPQPALLGMLSSGFSPIYPAHVAPSQLRSQTMGTGPFKLKVYTPDQAVELEKNPDYWLKGRPYLDGVHLAIIRKRSTRLAHLISGKADMEVPYQVTEPIKRQLEKDIPNIQFQLNSSGVSTNLIFNTKKPPFDNPKLRKAVALALDRNGLVKGLYSGVSIAGGGAMLPAPYGAWGMPEELMAQVPGMGDGARNKEAARQIMRELGYGPEKPLQVQISARNLVTYTDPATWAISELKQVYVEAVLEAVESGNWHGKVARRDFQIGMNRTANGGDEPDITFYEHYACKSQRNYSDFCDSELERKVDAQSQEVDVAKRKALVNEIDLALQQAGARPMLLHTTAYVAYYPHVKNFVLHQIGYSQYRMQEIWLDK